MILFRVESGEIEEYTPYTQIMPTGKYREYLDTIPTDDNRYSKVVIETTLAKVQGTDIRLTGLFLFGELKDALIFSSKMYHGNSIIYMVKPSGDVLYKGDMNTLDALTTAINLGLHEISNRDLFEGFCRKYWKHGKTYSPCYEYIVTQATVQRVICTKEECNMFHHEYSDNTATSFLSVERSSVYRQKINEVYDQ